MMRCFLSINLISLQVELTSESHLCGKFLTATVSWLLGNMFVVALQDVREYVEDPPGEITCHQYFIVAPSYRASLLPCDSCL